jgi:nicotinamide-nucleotide amidase
MFSREHLELASTVLDRCRHRGLHLATAESCTGGLIAGCLTGIPGSSHVVDRGFVTYSNSSKTEMLGVPSDVVTTHGAVSEEVARAMAEGALAAAGVDITVAVTGIAGPDGGTSEKAVGLVHIAVARLNGETSHERHMFKGGREEVRLASVAAAFRLLVRRLA